MYIYRIIGAHISILYIQRKMKAVKLTTKSDNHPGLMLVEAVSFDKGTLISG